MESQDLMRLIQVKFPKLSKGQKLIAEYILKNYDKAAFMTAAKLGNNVGVSESTVVRFATELGFSGYPKLQKALQELIKNKLDMQYAHYLSIQESHMRVKKLYHDINNHIYCIDNLRNNSKEINEYVNNLKDEIKTFKYIYNTGNMILDIIINEKSEICLKKGIKFTCSINFSKVNFVKPIDVSSIFSNILDNAIEACDKIVDENINK